MDDDLLEGPVVPFVPKPEEDENYWPPVGASLVASGVVLGEPKPAGSKVSGVAMRWDASLGRRVPIPRENGEGFKTFTKDDSGLAGKTWRADIRAAVLANFEGLPPLDEPLALSLVFYATRPAGHYGSGKNAAVLKLRAPTYPHQSSLPDGTKLARAFEDALNKLVWKDDRRFVDFRWSRRYGSPRVVWHLYRLPKSYARPVEGERSLSLPVE